jgi:hypothetical protein
MRKIGVVIIVLALVGIGAMLFLVKGGAAQTTKGYISDSMCGKHHVMPGASDEECTEACVKAGAKYVLVAGETVYTLDGDVSQLKPFGGKQVAIEGTINGANLTVQKVTAVN